VVRIIIVDDHPLIREGVKKILKEERDFQVVAEAVNTAEIIALLQKQEADILLLDINMPGRSGIDVLSEIHTIAPELRVLVLTIHPEDSLAVRALKAGASGYITKDAIPSELVAAIRRVAEGHKYISNKLAEQLAESVQMKTGDLPHRSLSEREYEVFVHIASGKTLHEIANELSLSPPTVSTYRARIMEKMNLHSNAELMHYALSKKLIE
jgi:two-component system, NarL family, invasion response regulator UvrY